MRISFSAFVEGIPTFLISVMVVFVMLGLLIGAIVILGKVLGATTRKKVEPIVEATIATAVEEVAATEEMPVQDDLELVAVITAVIAASMGTTSDQLQVRSLRKIPRRSL